MAEDGSGWKKPSWARLREGQRIRVLWPRKDAALGPPVVRQEDLYEHVEGVVARARPNSAIARMDNGRELDLASLAAFEVASQPPEKKGKIQAKI